MTTQSKQGLGTFLHSILAKHCKVLYGGDVQQKEVELALTGYKEKGAQSANRAFFVRNISMRSHFMAKLERDTFTCAGYLFHQSVNPFQFCHPHIIETGKTSV